MKNIKSTGLDIAAISHMMINKVLGKKNNRGPSGYKDGNKSNSRSELLGELISIFDDIVEVQDEGGQIHAFRLVGLDIPTEFGDLKGLDIGKLEVGDTVRINLEEGLLTLIQKVIKSI